MRLRQLAKYVKTMLGRDMLRELQTLNVELCTRCNLQCQYCSLQPVRQRFISLNLYEKLLHELYTRRYAVPHLNLSHSAEALLHPQFLDFLDVTKHYRNHGLQLDCVAINTNLTLLDAEYATAILAKEVIDLIVCSIDGRDQASFETLRPFAKYDQILTNFETLINHANRPEVWINCGLTPELANQSMDARLHQAFLQADRVIEYLFHNWTGTIQVPFHQPTKGNSNRFCPFAFDTVVLHADGLVGMCCSDLNGSTCYGDFTQSSLQSIFHSWQRKQRLTVQLVNRHLNKGCERCTR